MMNMIERFSLAKQLRYGLVLLVSLSVLCTGSALIVVSFREEMRLLRDTQRERSRAAAKEIDAYIDDLQRKLGYLARVRGLSELSSDTQRTLLEALTRHNTAYETVAIADERGQVLAITAPYDNAFAGDLADVLAFRRAYQEREDFFSPVEFDRAANLPMVTMAVPIRNAQDEVAGALLAKVNLEFLWFVVSNVEVGSTGYAYVVDERRFLIAQKGDLPESGVLDDLSEHPFIRQFSTRREVPVTTYRGLRGERVLGAVADIASVNWHVVVELPLTEAYAPVRRMLKLVGGTFVFAAFAALGLGGYLSGQFIRPLRTLTAAAERIRAGDFDVKARVTDRHELGSLAATFNSMTAKLRELISGLEQNVAELQAKETALRTSEQKYRQLLEALQEGIWVIDENARTTFVNPHMAEMLGYTVEEMQGQHLFSFMDERGQDISQQNLERRQQGIHEQHDFEFLRKDGARIYTLMETAPIHGDDGDYAGAIAGVVDITERRLAEEERKVLIADLGRKNAELERFTYTVSHDLKSPLITIKGFLGMLKQDALSGERERMEQDIHYIADAADNMSSLLSDLLELSRIGRIVKPSENIALGPMIDDALTSVAGSIAETGTRVHVASDLPTVYADRTRIRELFENLIGNAVKFMGDQREPCLEIGVRKESEEVIVFVRDNGIGIDPAYQEKVFGLFERLNPNIEGTGIGLSIVKRVVELHGGRIWVESEGAGKGTTFCLTLPKTPDNA